MREAVGMFVCEPTNYMKDVETLEAILSGNSKLGGNFPPLLRQL